MPELIQTLKAISKKETESRKFTASLKGISLENDEEKENSSTFEDVRRRALGIDASSDDVVSLQGEFAAEAGFGIGAGLGYVKE
jgi:N-acetylglucosamine kinase-like BadF-type ATPase